MSFRAVSNVIEHAPEDTTASEMLILIILADYTDDESWGCWPSVKTLAKKTRLSRSTVIRALNKLVKNGELKIEPRTGKTGVDRSNRYILSDRYQGVGYQSDTLESQNDTLGYHHDTGEGVTMTPDPINIDPKKEDTNVSSKKFRKLLDLWREIFPEKPQPRISNKTLQGKFNTRMKDSFFRDNYEKALRVAGQSQFLRQSGWFDPTWFLKNDSNWENCLNGKYTRTFSSNGQHHPSGQLQFDMTVDLSEGGTF